MEGIHGADPEVCKRGLNPGVLGVEDPQWDLGAKPQ